MLEKSDSSLEECFDLCKKYSDCATFFMGTPGTTVANTCQLRRAGCEYVSNTNWEYFSVKDCSYGGKQSRVSKASVKKFTKQFSYQNLYIQNRKLFQIILICYFSNFITNSF